MKILILASWYPNSQDSIHGIFVKEQAKALVESGIEVRVFYPFDKCAQKRMTKSEEDGIITYRCNTDYIKNSKISRINSAIKTIGWLNDIKKEFDFELIHCHVCYFSGIIAYFYKKLRGTKYLITEHMSYIESYAQKLYNRMLLKRAYSSAETVVCVSSYLADNLSRLGFVFKKKVIGNVVDVANFCHESERYFNDEHVNITFVGSMGEDEVKGVSYLLYAFEKLSKLRDDVRLHLIGDGEKRREYEDLAKSLEIASLCTFYGKMKNKSIGAVLRSSSFFVLPSKHETFGVVIIEALASGIPVVTTDVGAQKEIINDPGLGCVVKSEDVDSLSQGLLYMAENYKNYDKRHLLERALDYSYENIAKMLIELYNTLI